MSEFAILFVRMLAAFLVGVCVGIVVERSEGS